MANAYGIDMGNVLSVRDRTKINKLRTDKMERENKIHDAGVSNRKRRLKNKFPGLTEEQIDNEALNPEEFKYERGREDKKEDRDTAQSNYYARVNYSNKKSKELADYKHKLTSNFETKETNRRKTILKSMHPDMSEDLLDAYAADQTKDFSKIVKVIAEADNVETIDAVEKEINKYGSTLYAIKTIEDPAKQQMAWGQFRDKLLKSIKDPKVMAKKMEEIPEKYDDQWTTMTITSGVEIMESAKKAKDLLKKTKAEMQQENGNPVGGPTYPQQTAKVNAISKKVDNYFKDIDDPEAALEIKDEAVRRWKKGGMKQNEDSIIKAVIKEYEEADAAGAAEELPWYKKLMGGSSEKKTKKKSNKKFTEGNIYRQNGIEYKYTNGKFIRQ